MVLSLRSFRFKVTTSNPRNRIATFSMSAPVVPVRAKVLAVRAWRRRGARYLDNVDNPFTGVKSERLDHFPEDTQEWKR